MSDDKKGGRRSRNDEDRERRNDSGDRNKTERDHDNSSRRSENQDPKTERSDSRRSGRSSRPRSNDRKSSRGDENPRTDNRKSPYDDRKSTQDDRKQDQDDRKSTQDGRKSTQEDRKSTQDDRKSNQEDEYLKQDRKSRISRTDNGKSTDDSIEASSILAELADGTCRYGDCLLFLTEVVHARKYLNDKQRDMLWSSFRNHTNAKRNSWRKSVELEKNSDKGAQESAAAEYKSKLSKKIVAICKSVLTLIDEYLMPHLESMSSRNEDTDSTAQIFYLKIKGDAYRYMWEITLDKQDRKDNEDEAGKSYERAFQKAVKDLNPGMPLRLGLTLNYAVFYFEVQNNSDKALSLAKKASDDAEPEIAKLSNDDKMASESIIASLEHNIDMWKKGKN